MIFDSSSFPTGKQLSELLPRGVPVAAEVMKPRAFTARGASHADGEATCFDVHDDDLTIL